MTNVQIYTDGSARGNPDGPGGYGVVLHFTDSQGQLHEKTMSGGYVRTTNNRMELMAAIVGLEAGKERAGEEYRSLETASESEGEASGAVYLGKRTCRASPERTVRSAGHQRGGWGRVDGG